MTKFTNFLVQILFSQNSPGVTFWTFRRSGPNNHLRVPFPKIILIPNSGHNGILKRRHTSVIKRNLRNNIFFCHWTYVSLILRGKFALLSNFAKVKSALVHEFVRQIARQIHGAFILCSPLVNADFAPQNHEEIVSGIKTTTKDI